MTDILKNCPVCKRGRLRFKGSRNFVSIYVCEQCGHVHSRDHH